MGQRCVCQGVSFRMRVLDNVLDRILAGVDLLSVCIRDLNGKFILKGHDDLNRVKAVESQVVEKVRTGGQLGGVNLLEVLQAAQNPVCRVSLIQEGGGEESAWRLRPQGEQRRDSHALEWSAGRQEWTATREHGERTAGRRSRKSTEGR